MSCVPHIKITKLYLQNDTKYCDNTWPQHSFYILLKVDFYFYCNYFSVYTGCQGSIFLYINVKDSIIGSKILFYKDSLENSNCRVTLQE